MADNAEVETAEELEQLLGELERVERFEPSAELRARARVRDDVYEKAERDPEGYWAEQARTLHWDRPFTAVLDDSRPPFFTWFADGALSVSYNCLDRHIEAGIGDRVAYHWRGEEGEERDITYADLHRDVQQLANGLKDLGIRRGCRRHLPADDPRGRRDAGLRPDRCSAQRGLRRLRPDSVRERMEVSDAKALITVDGARRKGRTAAIKHEVDRVVSGLTELRSIVVVRHTGIDCAMQDGRDVFYDELLVAVSRCVPLSRCRRSIRCSSCSHPARRRSRRASCTPPAATHRDVFDLKADTDVFWRTADVGWVTGHS
jgi:acetyl-CoA synthetase